MRNVLIVMGRYLPGYKDGGPIQTIKNLTDRLGDDYKFHILTTDRDHGDESPYVGINVRAWNYVGKAEVWYVPPGGFKPQLVNRLAAMADVVYVCGCFNDYARVVLRLKHKGIIKASVVVAPMGLFSKGAMSSKYIKKRLYLGLCKSAGWFRDIVFSVTSEAEKQDVYREIGTNAKCIVAKDLPKVISDRSNGCVEKIRGQIRVVFFYHS